MAVKIIVLLAMLLSAPSLATIMAAPPEHTGKESHVAVGPGDGGEGLGRGSVGLGEGCGNWFVSIPLTIGPWKKSVDKITNSIIPYFMISPSPTARPPVYHFGTQLF